MVVATRRRPALVRPSRRLVARRRPLVSRRAAVVAPRRPLSVAPHRPRSTALRSQRMRCRRPVRRIRRNPIAHRCVAAAVVQPCMRTAHSIKLQLSSPLRLKAGFKAASVRRESSVPHAQTGRKIAVEECLQQFSGFSRLGGGRRHSVVLDTTKRGPRRKSGHHGAQEDQQRVAGAYPASAFRNRDVQAAK